MSFKTNTRVTSTVGTSPTPQCFGLYIASVVNTNDPLVLNRIQVQIPQVLGTATSNWAVPLGLSNVTGPVKVGQLVYVSFIGGDRNLPVYIPQSWVNASNPVFNNGLTVTGGATIDIVNGPLTIYKTGSGGTTRTNTTVSNDPDLSGISIALHGVYRVEVVLNVAASTGTGNIQYQFTIPSGAAGNYIVEQYNLAGTFQFVSSLWTANNTASTTAPGANGLVFKGILDNTGNPAGNFSFQWGQQTNNGSTNVAQYSYVKLERIR